MRCDEFADRLDELLDDNRVWDVHFLENNPVADEQALADHARLCANCRELAVAYGILMEGLAQLTVPEPAEGLAARVVTELHTTNQAPLPALTRRQFATTRRAPWLAGMAVMAAALLLTVIPWLPGRFQEGEPTSGPITSSIPTTTPDENTAHGAATKDLGLARQTRQSFVAAWPLVRALSDPWTLSSRPAEQAVTQSTESKWSEQVAEGLSPVTQSTVGAVDSLWQAIPTDLAAEPLSHPAEEPRS